MIDQMLIRGAKVHSLKKYRRCRAFGENRRHCRGLRLRQNHHGAGKPGPGGGASGGQIVATGTPEEIEENPNSITGRYL